MADYRETGRPREREILPRDLRAHYIEARMNTWASNSERFSSWDLTVPGSKGFVYPAPGMEAEHPSPYLYKDIYIDGKENGSFSGRETNTSGGNENDLITLYSCMGGLTGEGMELGEGFIYGRLLRGFLKDYSRDLRFGKNFSPIAILLSQMPQTIFILKSVGKREGRTWHDEESIEIEGGPKIYVFKGEGIYNPEARRRALLTNP